MKEGPSTKNMILKLVHNLTCMVCLMLMSKKCEFFYGISTNNYSIKESTSRNVDMMNASGWKLHMFASGETLFWTSTRNIYT